MPSLPPISAFNAPTTTEGQFKSAFSDLRAFLADLLGEAGTAAAARSALQAPASRVLGNGVDLNTVVEGGMYWLGTTITNKPSGAADLGQLLVVRGGSDTIAQAYFDYTASGNVYVRAGNPPQVGGSGSWGTWHLLATQAWVQSQIGNLLVAPTAGSTHLILRLTDLNQEYDGYYVSSLPSTIHWGKYARGYAWYMTRGGVIRVAYQHKREAYSTGWTVIYRNGTSVSTQSHSSDSYTEQNVDITVSAGDHLAVAAWTTKSYGQNETRDTCIRNVRILSGTPAFGAAV